MNTQNFKVNSLQTAMFAAISAFSFATASHALEKLDDNALANVTGKELAQFTTIKPGELGNPNGNVGFYRLALDAKIEMNSNIKKLRLGCDDPSGNGPCDISIDNVALSGIVPKTGGSKESYEGVATADINKRLKYARSIQEPFRVADNVGAGTDFVMDKPFIELAIKNPDSLTDRKLVGYRFGAHETWGIMSTGEGPPLNADGSQKVDIIGPESYGSNVMKNYGSGNDALKDFWEAMTAGTKNRYQWLGQNPTASDIAERKARYKEFTKYLNASVERGHTGVNYISGRLPVRLNNLNVNASVYDIWKNVLKPLNININRLGNNGYYIQATAQTAIVAGRPERSSTSDFGRWRKPQDGDTDPSLVPVPSTDPESKGFIAGYLRNTYLGDADTVYDPSVYGKYVANTSLPGRAITLKRGSRAYLDNMIVNVHNLNPDIRNLNGLLNIIKADDILKDDTGDRLNTQDIATRTFHQLQYGEDKNGNFKYDKGEGAKHFAFSYQSLDGLQWITTDKRFASAYDKDGNPAATATIMGPAAQQGYDWLSTRAGWWLESPLATVSNGFVPLGQATSFGTPKLDSAILLKSLDLGARPIDNCYGKLTFC